MPFCVGSQRLYEISTISVLLGKMTFLMTVRTKTTTSTRTAKTMRTLTIIHFYFQVPQLPDADASLESVDLSEDDRGQAGLEAFLAEVKRKKVIYVNFLKVKKIKYYFQQQKRS